MRNSLNKRPLYKILYIQVIFAILLGIALGHFYPDIGESLKPLGDAFIKIVKMIIAPVIFLTVATGIAGMNNMKAVGNVIGKSMLYFFNFFNTCFGCWFNCRQYYSARRWLKYLS